MNKNKWKDIFDRLIDQLQFLRLDDDIDLEDDLQIEDAVPHSDEPDREKSAAEDLETKLRRNRKWRIRRRVFLGVLLVGVIAGFVLYNKLHTFNDYVIAESYENEVAGGTSYEAVGKYIYRYNADGVSCLTRKCETKWSITYNMQAPIADVCDDTMVIAEQQGNQIYIVNQDGLMGSFETLIPILKVRVSQQGVVAAVLREDDVTWVNLYQLDGTIIASDKTTVTESGYPVDIDVSPDGQKLLVSYLGIWDGIIRSDVIFYHFGTAGQTMDNYVVSSQSYQDEVIPEVYFNDNSSAVAVSDSGYYVFKGSDAPEESASVHFEDEIISTFHDEERIGFLFRSTEEDFDYRIELYNYRGKRKMSEDINASFDQIKLENDQILLYSDRACSVYTTSGHLRFTSAYEKDISEMFYFSEYRKYLIITDDSFDKIRIS